MISFCIPFWGNESTRLGSLSFVHRELLQGFPAAEVLVASSGEANPSRSAARNRLAQMAQGEILVFVDADSIAAADQIERAIALAFDHGWSFPYDRYYSLTAGSSWDLVEYGQDIFVPDFEYVFPGADPVDRPPAVGGMVVVRRSSFEAVDGYDERFIGWGFEDRAFAVALQRLHGPALRVPGPLYHLWHPAPREETDGQPHFEENRLLYNDYLSQYGDLV